MATSVNPVLTFMGQPGVYAHREADVLPRGPEPDGGVAVRLLDQRHAEYDLRYETWVDLSLLYDNGAALKNRCERLLKKRPREDEEVYAARMDRFTSQPILSMGLGWYGAALFDTPPEVFFNGGSKSVKDNFYDKFLDDCDGIGTTYIDYFKRVFQILLTYGAGWVLTDIESVGDDEQPPLTLEDERVRGFLDPHLIVYTPLNIINWKEDEVGRFEWVVVRTEAQEQEFLKNAEIVTTWYCYDRTTYKVYEDRRKPEEQIRIATDDSGRIAKLLRQGTHSLASVKRVPVRRLMLSEGLWLANRAYLLLVDHLNQDNSLAWALFMSNLCMPVIIGDVDANHDVYSETGYLQFPAGTEYKWSEPDGKSFTISAKRVESLREECFRSMNLQAQGRSMRATPAMQSGRSKQLEMAPAKQVLASMGDDVRRHMQAVLVDVKDARRDYKVEPDVRGFNFEDDMTVEEIFAVTSLLSLKIPSRKFEKYVQKKIAKSWMTDANRDELVKVYDEIEAGPTMEEQQQQEFDRQQKAAKENMRSALQSKMPPGRGGSGPKPNSDGEVKE